MLVFILIFREIDPENKLCGYDSLRDYYMYYYNDVTYHSPIALCIM